MSNSRRRRYRSPRRRRSPRKKMNNYRFIGVLPALILVAFFIAHLITK